jgi:hypothetical protein
MSAKNQAGEGERAIVPDVEVTALQAITAAEIDQQIATAHAFPRKVRKCMDDLIAWTTLDEETAQSCFYSVPRAGGSVSGPSIRFAECLMNAWGNLRVGSRLVEVRHDRVVSEGVCHDLESNVAMKAEVSEAIVKSDGKTRYTQDGISNSIGAAGAKARRNAILAGIPQAIWKPALMRAKQVAIGDAATLGERRKDALQKLASMGVHQDRVLYRLNKSSVLEITLDDLMALGGAFVRCRDGESEVDDEFPDPAAADAKPTKPSKGKGGGDRSTKSALDDLSDELAGDDGAPPAPAPTGKGKGKGKPKGKPKAKPKDGDDEKPETRTMRLRRLAKVCKERFGLRTQKEVVEAFNAVEADLGPDALAAMDDDALIEATRGVQGWTVPSTDPEPEPQAEPQPEDDGASGDAAPAASTADITPGKSGATVDIALACGATFQGSYVDAGRWLREQVEQAEGMLAEDRLAAIHEAFPRRSQTMKTLAAYYDRILPEVQAAINAAE